MMLSLFSLQALVLATYLFFMIRTSHANTLGSPVDWPTQAIYQECMNDATLYNEFGGNPGFIWPMPGPHQLRIGELIGGEQGGHVGRVQHRGPNPDHVGFDRCVCPRSHCISADLGELRFDLWLSFYLQDDNMCLSLTTN